AREGLLTSRAAYGARVDSLGMTTWPQNRTAPQPDVAIRPACPGDGPALAVIMATRGGTPSDHAPAAHWLLDQAPVLVVAEVALPEGPEVVGWSGATQTPLHAGGPAQWLTAGLTVEPAFRRRGIGHRLLQAVIEAVGTLHGDALHSVVNARNAASIALHDLLGFTVLETGPCFAGIEFDGGVGVLLTRPTGASSSPPAAD
ncbi:GNAT family N-acetyltransferase, partial [Micrococcus luteus]|uniref:GNAT family N-acetyltransferase n=2 Tax=Micrococcus luteus TaxID=1270 RepID=UPI000668025C